MGLLDKLRIHKKKQAYSVHEHSGEDGVVEVPVSAEDTVRKDEGSSVDSGASVDYTADGDERDEDFHVEDSGEDCESQDESLDTRSMISDTVSDVEAVGLNALATLELEDKCATMPSEMSRRHLIKKYNDVAVHYMENKDFDHSLGMLEKAEALLDSLDASVEASPDAGDEAGLTRSRLRSMTYNNFGCLYRRISLPEKALEYLEKALVIEEMSNNVNECAATHLNLSASHSVLHNDMQALRHGEKAIILIQGQLWPGSTFQEGLAMLVLMLQDATRGESWRVQAIKDAHVLAMAYHNVGTQNERLGRLKEAQVSFSRACSIGMKILGPRSVTTAALIRGNKLFQERLRDGNAPGHTIASSKHTTSSLSRTKSTSNVKGRQSETSRVGMGMKTSKSTTSLSGKTAGKKTKVSRGTLPFKR